MKLLNFSDCIEGMQPIQGAFTKEIISLNNETNQANAIPNIISCSKFIAISIQQTLSVYNIDLSINNHETLFEIDFDENILVIAWDLTESCLVLGDASGSLHLVTSDGNLLFSKKIVNDFKTQRIIHLQFLLSHDKNEQTLYVIMDDGSSLVINNMDPESILETSRNTPSLLASYFQKLAINKTSLSVSNKIKQVLLVAASNDIQEIQMIMKDENEQLLLSNTDKSIQNIKSTKIIYTDCSDFYVFEFSNIKYGLVLYKNHNIVLIELSTCKTITQLTSNSYVSQLSVVSSTHQSLNHNEIFQMLILLHINSNDVHVDSNERNSDTYQIVSLSIFNNIGKFINLSTPIMKTIEKNYRMITNNQNHMTNIDQTYFILADKQKINVFKYSEGITSIWNELQINNQSPTRIENISLLSIKDIALIIRDYHRMSTKNEAQTNSQSIFNVDLYIRIIASLTSFVDILHVTYLLLDFPNPEKGFILTLLSASENAIEKIPIKQNQQAMKQKYLLEILKLHHYYETVIMILNFKDNNNKRNHISEEEELIRTTLLGLLPNNIMDTVLKYLSLGEIQEAITVIQRCTHSEMHTDHTKLLRLIPDNASVDELITWIKEIVLSNITSLSFSTVISQPTEKLDQNSMNNIISLASELVVRAQKMEKVNGNPFDAIKLLNTAIEATSVIPYSYENAIPLMNQMKFLYQNMKLQAQIWDHWDDHFSLEDVTSLGFKGLAFDRIDCIPESELIHDINIKIMPLVESFYELGIDSLLMGWIKESIATRIVTAGDDVTNDSEEKENCSFTRLVKVTSLIQDKNIQAKMVLTLLQMPVLEEMSNSNMSLNDDDDVYNNLNKKSSKQSRASFHCESTRILCDLAATTYDYVDVASREALVEATRLLKVKAIASNYGVESFDPRNSKQVRAVVAIVANSVDNPNAIQDAVEFAASWGANSIDVNAVLTRAIILRATNGTIYSENNMKYEGDLKQTLEVLPLNRKHIIIEDALKYLIDEIEEATENLVYDPIINKLVEDTKVSKDEESNAEMLVRCTMILVSYYIDFVKADTTDCIGVNSNKPNITGNSSQVASFLAGTLSTKKRIRTHSSMNRFWINSELLINLKRVHSLQVYGIYLCLNDLDNKEICQAVVSKLAKSRGLLLLESLNETNVENKSNVQRLTHLNTPLNSTCRKICVLLNICTTFFIHTTMKFLVESSETELAMEVAETLTKEKLLYSSNNFTSYAQNTSDYVSTNGSSRDTNASEVDIEAMKETSLLLDAAVTLCSIAAKKANQISQEDYSILPSFSLLGCDDVIPEYISFPIASFKLSRDLLRSSVVCCPSLYLGRTLDLINGSETVLAVYDRVEGVNKAISYTDNNSHEIITGVISDGSFARDGILMQPQTVVLPLMKFAFGEIKRKETHSYIKKSNSVHKMNSNNNGNNVVEQHAPDLEEIVRILQRSENHLLAVRILYGSWHNSSFKAKALCSSLLSLGRKVLTYRDIDIPFSVACLAALSYETMVKELKSAVPNIQSDFSRLQVVALVGEELSHLWDQESLLLLFQGLQMNAKWWSILSSLGMKVDLRIFQNPDANIREKFMKSIIPDLLEKGNMDLDMVTEYCRQFDLEPEHATLTYIELLLTSSPKSIHDFSWISKVRNASENVEDSAVLLKLKELLPRTHSLDYEKIRYVCTWIMDLLASAEEEIDSIGGIIDHPNDMENIPPSRNSSSRSSLKDKALKVPVVPLVSKTMDSSNCITEIESYKRYFDIATYLAGLKFPKEATSAITCHETSDKNFSSRKNLADSYQERIPLWQLFNDPWSVLDPLLTEAPECASKIAPLCTTLKIDKSLFNSRKIMALYTRMTAKREGSTSTTEYSAAHKECKNAAIATACESIEASIANPIQQLELWKWIYLKERTNVDDEFSMFALENALKIAKKNPKYEISNSIQDNKLLTLESLTQEMRFLKCEHAIKRFHNSCLTEVPQVKDMLLNTLSNPALLIRYLLEVAMEISWDRYTQDLQQLGSVVTVLTLANYPPSHEVLAFIHKASIVIDEVAQYCDLNSPLLANAQSQDNNSQTILLPTQLEVIRHHLIGKMLSDIDTNNHSISNNSNTYDKDGNTQSTNNSFSSNINTTSISGSNTGIKHTWGLSDECAYLPSTAEKRRREDLHLSLSIAALVLSCSNINQRQAYMTQLDTVFRGKGVRVMRRLTSRSKYRACQALSYLQVQQQHNIPLDMKNISNTSNELNLFRGYLYCLSEMHEIRLPCSDELLLDAMGLALVDNEIKKVHACDPRALVRTWIHDEGMHAEVVELARDLLLVCQYDETIIWFQLIQHMINKAQHRVLLQTLLITSKSKVFSELCFGSMLGCELLLAMSKLYTETIDRVENTIQLAQLREQVDHFTCTCEYSDWLSLSTVNAMASTNNIVNNNSATTSDTISSNSIMNDSIHHNNHNHSLIGDLHKRVFITPKLSYRTGEWEESPPEDVLLSFTHIAMIIQHILHNIPSRMKYGQMKCTISITTIQSDCLKICNLLNNFNNNNNYNKRNIMTMTLQSIMFCINSLLNPSIYLIKPSCNESYQTCITQLVDILLNLSNNSKQNLWNVLTIIIKKFDKNNIINDVFYDFIMSKKSIAKHQIMLLFEIIGMYSIPNTSNSSDSNVEELAITFIQFIANRMVANDLDILDIKQAILEQSIEVKKNLIKQMKTIVTKKNINIDKIQILIQNILS